MTAIIWGALIAIVIGVKSFRLKGIFLEVNGTNIKDLFGQTIDNVTYYSDRNYRMVLAFQMIGEQVVIIDRTAVYR